MKKAVSLLLWSEELRDDLIELCRQRRLTQKEARVWAQELRFPPLPAQPDVNHFDPIREPEWSLGMALAWIMTGNVDDVREMWEEWREAQAIWVLSSPERTDHPPPLGGQLKSLLFDLSELSAGATLNRASPRSLEDAEHELWRALSGGRVVATGLPLEGGAREAIPAFRWRNLDLFEERRRLVVKDDTIARSGFRDVAISSSKTKSIWRLASKAQTTRVDREAQCFAWLAENMRDSPDSPPKLKAEFLAEALKKFAGISEAAFNRAWSDAVKSTGAKAWSRAGRRPKSPRKKSRTIDNQ